ncbi:MAG: C2 family cysteine protease [Candidatus Falkowbacteria bacterium]
MNEKINKTENVDKTESVLSPDSLVVQKTSEQVRQDALSESEEMIASLDQDSKIMINDIENRSKISNLPINEEDKAALSQSDDDVTIAKNKLITEIEAATNGNENNLEINDNHNNEEAESLQQERYNNLIGRVLSLYNLIETNELDSESYTEIENLITKEVDSNIVWKNIDEIDLDVVEKLVDTVFDIINEPSQPGQIKEDNNKVINIDTVESEATNERESIITRIRMLEKRKKIIKELKVTDIQLELRIEYLKNKIADFGERREKEIDVPLITEAREHLSQVLDDRGLMTMSKTEYEEFFGSTDFGIHSDLKQQNVGDCYAVAAIHAMRCSPNFELLVRTSMKKNKDGTWDVKIPLLDKNGQTVNITPEELLPQRNEKFLQKKGKYSVDLRPKLRPAAGKEGFLVLEAAYIKLKFGEVDRLAAEGGQGEEFLKQLGGDSFKTYNIISSRFNNEGEFETPGLKTLSGEDGYLLDYFLENFDPETHMATVNTKFFNEKNVVASIIKKLGFYREDGSSNFFVPGHAYSLSCVDKINKTVTVNNPWNTTKKIEIPFDIFKNTFSDIRAIRIDNTKLLNSASEILSQAA